jgi:hypothetical protein
MRTRRLITAALVLASLVGCAMPASRITDYLSGFQAAAPSSLQPGPAAGPIVAGLVLALPETEIGKPTTPPLAALEKVAARIQKELQQSSHIVIQQIFPALTIPASGLHGLALERVQALAQEANLTKMLVVVATSRSAQKLRFWPVMEHQLYVSMDAALVEIPSGRVLVTESGEDDYVMAEALDYVARISFPRLYYRTFTITGPFTVVEGDPYKALGETAFQGAADQLGMKLRMRLNPERA